MLRANKGYKFLNPEDIVYAKSIDKYSEIHLADSNSITVFHSFSELEEILTKFLYQGNLNFVRIHRQYIVSIYHAIFLDKNLNLHLNNKTVVKIGRSKFYEIKKQLLPLIE